MIRAALLFSVLASTILCAQDPSPGEVTAKDLPRLKPLEPAEAIKSFQLARGAKLELVAAEPLVADPVDACFDEFGRMYVAEMHGYPFSQEPTRLNPKGGGKKDAGIIRLLEDTDDDGRMDRSTVFADGLSWPTSVVYYDRGVFVLAPKFLYYLKDTDGDLRADAREVVLAGFGRGNVQGLTNNLKWGLDHRIYFAAGRNPTPLEHRGKKLFSARGSDLSFDPKREDFTRVTGGQQFGHSLDDHGNRFVCSNSDHIRHVVFPRRYLARNPYLASSQHIRSIASDGNAARVFRSSPPEPWRIIRQKWRAAAKGYRLVITEDGAWKFEPADPSKRAGVVPTEYPVGYFTSATGVTIYRGGAYPSEYRGNAFIGDVGGNLVHRKTLRPRGVTFRADRADAGEEYVRSSDTWFRPVNFVNAPDGTIYILDMYRETIEHPHSIPKEIKQHLDLQSGSDRGRIYRLRPPGTRRSSLVKIGTLKGAQLANQLESDDVWRRESAQRLIWERRDHGATRRLEEIARSSSKPLARLHALYALHGLDALGETLLHGALKDRDAAVRAHAVRLAEEEDELLPALLPLTNDRSDRVRFQLAFSLGETSDPRATEGLAELARDSRNGPEIQTAILSSSSKRADQIVTSLLSDADFLKEPRSHVVIAGFCQIVGAQPDDAPSLRLVRVVVNTNTSLEIQRAVLDSLGRGLRRRGSSLAKVMAKGSADRSTNEALSSLFQRAANIATDDQINLEERIVAIGFLAFAKVDTALKTLTPLLSPTVPQALQRGAVATLRVHRSERVAAALLDAWPRFSPQLRRDASDALVSDLSSCSALLDAVEAERLHSRDLERDLKQRLSVHPDETIRARSRKLFAAEKQTDRAKVVRERRKAIQLTSDTSRGFEVYKKRCAVCHRARGMGHAVAPDLETTSNKSADDLLVAILDPNRELQSNFTGYTAVTKNGEVADGIIVAETATSLTLRRAEGRESTILRAQLRSLTSSGVSLMPEGLEVDLTDQDLADVIAFVRSLGRGAKK
ncbi:MAG: PVC-type heme-binding CxxCH protein [Planctomycetota bacterium]